MPAIGQTVCCQSDNLYIAMSVNRRKASNDFAACASRLTRPGTG